MKITHKWLKQYVDFDWTPEELAERLTMLGLEVEGLQKIAAEFEGVVVAQILASDKHPNADKLSVCRVTDGTTERQIVCGAKNFQVGNKVALILPGNTLPARGGEPALTIKAGKIRGVESLGMLCSEQELGLADTSPGILILPDHARLGQSFAEHLGKSGSDTVLDLEITPNRPDLISVIGIAREVSAVTGNPLRLPALGGNGNASGSGPAPKAADLVAVRLDDPELCARYAARVVLGVKVGPSPAWLREALERVGIRSINNVVDVTNYVMLETGQPLHAFDYRLIAPGKGQPPIPTIVVRRAQAGEGFVTLDGQKRQLADQSLLIADEQKAIALAGIMGGQNTEISDTTTDVLIESAWFKPSNIRLTSKQLELRTDASYRFERGADIGISAWANQRAADLILATAGGTLAEGVVDAYPKPIEPRTIPLRHAVADRLLGVGVAPAEQTQFLNRLGLQVAEGADPNAATTSFRIPSYRVDLKRETDLIEELARLYGVNRIPSTPPRGAVGTHPFDTVHDQLAEARRILTGLGLHEAQGQTLISETAAGAAAGSPERIVRLSNPLSSDMNVLRPSLIPVLLDALRHNAHHQEHDIALFEVGRVFVREADQVKEQRRLAIALTGHRFTPGWSGEGRDETMDLFDLKGVLEDFFEHYGIRGVAYAKRDGATGVFVDSGAMSLGKRTLGELGQIHPLIAKNYDLRSAVLVAELDLDLLLAIRNAGRSFRALPSFPAIRRDIAMLVPESASHENVVAAVRQAKPENLEQVEVFDVYRGKGVPEGSKSVAYSLVYRHPSRTLTDAEVNAVHERTVAQLLKSLNATLRG